MDNYAVAMIGWCSVYMDCVKLEDECIDSLDNLGFRHSTFKGKNEVIRVVIFCKPIFLSDSIEYWVDREGKSWQVFGIRVFIQ